MKKRQNAEVRKPAILESFYHTILEEGFEGASIAKVAKRININPTLIIHYFGNKENMTIEFSDYVIAEYSKLLKKVDGSKGGRKGDPEEHLMRLLKILWSQAYYEKIHIAVAFSMIAVSFRNQRLKKRIQRLYESFKKHLIKELDYLNQAGVIDVDDTRETAEVLLSMLEGSRHFRHFYIKGKDTRQYSRNMISAALTILKGNRP